MKRKLQRILLVFIIGIAIIPLVKVKAEGTVDTIAIYTRQVSVGVGVLPEIQVSVNTYMSPNITIEPYGSNTIWSKWESGMDSWHAFGTETPTAVKGETHYAMRLKVDLAAGYTFADNVTINVNDSVYNAGHTSLDKGFDWGGYLYIDLGTAKDVHTVKFETNGGTAIEDQTVIDGDYFYGDVETTKDGFNFGGWYLDENLTTELGDTPFTKDTTLYAKWVNESESKISSVNVTIKPPQIGTEVKLENHEDEYGAYQMPNLFPTVILENGKHILLGESYYIVALPSMNPEGYDEAFTGTFEKDKDYYLEVYLYPETGYEFAENVTLKVNDGTDYELSQYNGGRQLMFYAKIKAGTENPKVIKGANQVFSINSTEQLAFEFDIDFDEFKESGKVYMDGNLVDPKNYTIAKGSTIVTFNTSYTNNLSAGNHTVRVTSNNSDITTEFSVTSNPKTGDSIIIYVITSIVSILGLIITTSKKKIESK